MLLIPMTKKKLLKLKQSNQLIKAEPCNLTVDTWGTVWLSTSYVNHGRTFVVPANVVDRTKERLEMIKKMLEEYGT